MRERLTLRVVEDLGAVPAGEWNALAGGNPLLRHEFFSALHETGCASERAGWAGAAWARCCRPRSGRLSSQPRQLQIGPR